MISRVIVYTGHNKHPLLGPYADNIRKRTEMFIELNPYREKMGRPPWKVTEVAGEDLVQSLCTPKQTLLVIPSGQSTTLDKVFSAAQLTFLKYHFFEKGGRGYLTCGSAYWTSRTRIYSDLCTEQPTERKTVVKKSRIPLFWGVAEGPLCRYPGHLYKVGFYSDAVRVVSGNASCTVLLSGGGSFRFKQGDAKVQVLATYPHSELLRCGKPPEECASLETAAILARIGKGAAVLSMFHPYYDSRDVDVERYEKAFPNSGTNWKRIKEQLSPQDVRMRFVLEKIICPLEDSSFILPSR